MKAIGLAILSIIIYVLPFGCAAQTKQTKSRWFSVTTYESGMEVDGKVVIKDVNEFMKAAYSERDPIFTKEVMWGGTTFDVKLIDGRTDSNGKVLSTTLSVTHTHTTHRAGFPLSFEFKVYEEKFFRDRNECIKEKEQFKSWHVEKNKEYRSSIEKYQ